MNKWHLSSLVLLVVIINLVITPSSEKASTILLLGNSSKIATVLGVILFGFEVYFWKLPFLYPWFVQNPDISGVWSVKVTYILVDGPNTSSSTSLGIATLKQTFSTLYATIDYSDGGKMRFLRRAPFVAGSDGFCVFSATYQFETTDDKLKSAARYGGFYFHAMERFPATIDLHYSTSDNQVGSVRFTNREKRSKWKMLREMLP